MLKASSFVNRKLFLPWVDVDLQVIYEAVCYGSREGNGDWSPPPLSPPPLNGFCVVVGLVSCWACSPQQSPPPPPPEKVLLQDCSMYYLESIKTIALAITL